MVANTSSSGIYIEPTRQQRASLILRDVAYRLHAELQFIAPRDRGKTPNPVPEWLQDPEEMTALRTWPDENPGKYNAMFERRARKGQCFNQPYLGTREFSCAFRFVDNSESEEPPIDETRELGFMLYDMMFPKQGDVNQEIQSAFFRARLEKGVVVVPRWESEEVRR
jgi:CRISPR-associated protein Cas5d